MLLRDKCEMDVGLDGCSGCRVLLARDPAHLAKIPRCRYVCQAVRNYRRRMARAAARKGARG